MNLGSVFLLLAFLLFVLEGIGVMVIPRIDAWGLACLCLALLLAHYPWPWPPR